MMVSLKGLRGQFIHFIKASRRAGFSVFGWHLIEGSGPMGVSYQLRKTGQGSIEFPAYLGMTRVEAYAKLVAWTEGLNAVEQLVDDQMTKVTQEVAS